MSIPQPTADPGSDNFRTPPRRPGRHTEQFFNSMRRTGLVRSESRWIGGVAGGVAKRFGIDPTLVRCIWIVTCLFSGLGFLLYGLGWALLPEERDGRIHAQQALNGDVDAGLAGAVACLLVGISSGGYGACFVWGDNGLLNVAWSLLSLVLMGVIVVALVRALHHRTPTDSAAAAGQSGNSPYAQCPEPAPATPSATPPASAPAYAAAQAPNFSSPEPTAAQPGGTQAAGAPQPAPAPGGEVPPTSEPLPHSYSAEPKTADSALPEQWEQNAYAPRGAGANTGAAATSRGEAALPQPPAPYLYPRKMRASGPGARESFAVLGISFLLVSACVLCLNLGWLHPLSAFLVIAGALTLLLGAGVFACAVRGRRGGWMTGIGWLAVFIALPSLFIASVLPAGNINGKFSADSVTVNVTNEMLQNSQNEIIDLGNYTAASSVNVNLTNINADALSDTHLRLRLGDGNININTKVNLPIEINSDVTFGSVNTWVTTPWKINGKKLKPADYIPNIGYDLNGNSIHDYEYFKSGYAHKTTADSPQASANTPKIILDVSLGYGAISINEHSGQVTWYGAIYDGYWIVESWNDAAENYHNELPVKSMRHPALSLDQANECLETVRDGEIAQAEGQDENEFDSFDYSTEAWINLSTAHLSSSTKTALHNCFDQSLTSSKTTKQ